MNSVLGYPIDSFQQRSLAVIVHQELDLLAMAPTGSGKTAVALIAILQAFRRGKKAVYTSPIKALSNQKYSEFKNWFAGRGIVAGVSLLTLTLTLILTVALTLTPTLTTHPTLNPAPSPGEPAHGRHQDPISARHRE